MKQKRHLFAAAALTACFAAFLCACGQNGGSDATAEQFSTTPPFSEAEIFTMPDLPVETTAAPTKTDAANASTTKKAKDTGKTTTASSLPNEEEILQRIDTARAVYELFGKYRPQMDKEDSIIGDNETPFFRVTDPKLDSLDKLRQYVSGYFSDELTEGLMSVGLYDESDGKLYAVDAMVDVGTKETVLSRKAELTDHTKDSQTYLVTTSVDTDGDGKADSTRQYRYTYAQQGKKWVFTSFEMF